MIERSPNSNDILTLLSKLKAQTPDYPSDMMAARKAAFLSQIAVTNFDNLGRGGKGGGDGGSLSNGSGLFGGMTTAQGILLQAVIGVWVIAAMLTAAYVFRDQIIDLLQDYGIVSVEITQIPSIDSPIPVTGIPSIDPTSTLSTETPYPSSTAEPGVSSGEEAVPESTVVGGATSENPGSPTDKPGLHLGQTPGTPDTPNQSKPDKPDKPTKQNNK